MFSLRACCSRQGSSKATAWATMPRRRRHSRCVLAYLVCTWDCECAPNDSRRMICMFTCKLLAICVYPSLSCLGCGAKQVHGVCVWVCACTHGVCVWVCACTHGVSAPQLRVPLQGAYGYQAATPAAGAPTAAAPAPPPGKKNNIFTYIYIYIYIYYT